MFAMTDKKSKWPRGKCLGGSSMLNAMLYVRHGFQYFSKKHSLLFPRIQSIFSSSISLSIVEGLCIGRIGVWLETPFIR